MLAGNEYNEAVRQDLRHEVSGRDADRLTKDAREAKRRSQIDTMRDTVSLENKGRKDIG